MVGTTTLELPRRAGSASIARLIMTAHGSALAVRTVEVGEPDRLRARQQRLPARRRTNRAVRGVGYDGVRASVHDEGDGSTIATPEPRPERGGWGLMFVDRLSDSWGVEDDASRVWFRSARLKPAARAPVRPIGTHIGVPVTDSGITRNLSPKTPRRAPRRRSPPARRRRTTPSRNCDEVMRVAAAWLRSCSTMPIVRPCGVEVERAGRAPRAGGRGRGRWSARRAAGSACPGRAPSRSTRAGAGRRRAGRAGGRAGRRCRWPSAPTRPSRGPRRARADRAAGAGSGRAARDPRPSGPRAGPATAAGSRAACATSRVGSEEISAPSSSTCPPVGFSSRANARSSVDLPLALAPTIAVIWPAGSGQSSPLQDVALAVADGQARPRAGSCRPAPPEQDRQVRRADQRHDEAGRDLGRARARSARRYRRGASSSAPSAIAIGSDAAVVAAREQPRGVRREQADEGDRAADGDRRGAQRGAGGEQQRARAGSRAARARGRGRRRASGRRAAGPRAARRAAAPRPGRRAAGGRSSRSRRSSRSAT